MLHVLWEFEVDAASRAAFESAYGEDGAWVALFRRGDGYGGTSLLRDSAHPGRYLTVDRWQSRAHYEAFQQQHAAAYAALDRRCENLTLAEKLIGYFEEL